MTSPQNPSKVSGAGEAAPGHLLRIDILRALAILGVFCFHALHATFGVDTLSQWSGSFPDFSSAPNPAFLSFYTFTFGKYGVLLFFLISGFCIHYSFLKWERKQISTDGQKPKPAGFVPEFLWRRFWRIYPVYLFAMVFFVCLHETDIFGWKSIKTFVVHALLLHNLNPGHFWAINGPFWSIAVECQLYLIYPLVIWCRYHLGATRAFIALMIVSVLYERYAQTFFHSEAVRFAISQMPFAYWMQWLPGAWVAERLLNARSPLPGTRFWIPAGLVLFAVSSQYGPSIRWSYWLLIGVLTLLIEAMVRDQRPLTRLERLLVPVGLCSYSIYLFHSVLWDIYPLIHTHLYHGLPYVDLTVTLVACFLVILLPCWLSYRYLELGSIRLGSTLWRRWQGRMITAPLHLSPSPSPVSTTDHASS